MSIANFSFAMKIFYCWLIQGRNIPKIDLKTCLDNSLLFLNSTFVLLKVLVFVFKRKSLDFSSLYESFLYHYLNGLYVVHFVII